MRVAVWDTYVPRTDGRLMHFDILVEEGSKREAEVLAFGEEFLNGKGVNNKRLSTEACRFCHMEQATPEVEHGIKAKGYYIVEMENCQ